MGSRPCCLACQAIPTRYFFISASFTCNKKYPAYPSLCLKEEMISRKKNSELKRTMRTWSSSRLLRNFYCLCIVHFFLTFFVLRSRVRRRIFGSYLRQRMLLLYAGIKMKAFAFWSVFRRRNRRTWSVLVVRTSAVRIRSFVHSSSPCLTNVWQHDFLFLSTLIQD